jgi:hypothetical protein
VAHAADLSIFLIHVNGEKVPGRGLGPVCVSKPFNGPPPSHSVASPLWHHPYHGTLRFVWLPPCVFPLVLGNGGEWHMFEK